MDLENLGMDTTSSKELTEDRRRELVQIAVDLMKDGSMSDWHVRLELEKKDITEFEARQIVDEAKKQIDGGSSASSSSLFDSFSQPAASSSSALESSSSSVEESSSSTATESKVSLAKESAPEAEPKSKVSLTKTAETKTFNIPVNEEKDAVKLSMYTARELINGASEHEIRAYFISKGVDESTADTLIRGANRVISKFDETGKTQEERLEFIREKLGESDEAEAVLNRLIVRIAKVMLDANPSDEDISKILQEDGLSREAADRIISTARSLKGTLVDCSVREREIIFDGLTNGKDVDTILRGSIRTDEQLRDLATYIAESKESGVSSDEIKRGLIRKGASEFLAVKMMNASAASENEGGGSGGTRMVIGLVLALLGTLVTLGSSGHVIWYGAIIVGVIEFFRGLFAKLSGK